MMRPLDWRTKLLHTDSVERVRVNHNKATKAHPQLLEEAVVARQFKGDGLPVSGDNPG